MAQAFAEIAIHAREVAAMDSAVRSAKVGIGRSVPLVAVIAEPSVQEIEQEADVLRFAAIVKGHRREKDLGVRHSTEIAKARRQSEQVRVRHFVVTARAQRQARGQPGVHRIAEIAKAHPRARGPNDVRRTEARIVEAKGPGGVPRFVETAKKVARADRRRAASTAGTAIRELRLDELRASGHHVSDP
jgi:hypothetical protein